MAKRTERKIHDHAATATAVGSAIALDVAIVDGSGNQVTSFGGGSGASTIGAAVPATATAIGVKDNAGNLAYPQVDGSGNLLVAVTGAGSGGTSSVDGAGYTAGSTAGTPLMGAFDDASTTVLAENKVGIARLTTYRGLHSNLRDGTGNELIGALDYDLGAGTVTQGIVGIALPASGGPVAGGTGTNPIRTDPTGTTAQPITDNSGSITVDNSGTFPVQSTIAAGATNIAKAEDTASANADVGVPAMAIQLATPTDLAGTDADYAMLQMSGGRLWVDASGKTLTVNGSGVTQPISAASLPLPAGAATAAKQPALGTAGTAAADVITIQGITSMTKLLVTPDSVALPANQSVNAAQINGVTPLMGTGNTGTGSIRVTIATDQTQLTNKLLVTPDANSAVNVGQVGGTNIVTAGVNGTQAVGGNAATNVAIGTNPINMGAQAVSAENTAITATRMAQLVTDLVGKLIVLPYANPENFVSGAITSAMTGTTSTSLLAAPAAGLRNYITQVTISNSHATVGTDVIIQDGNGGTTLYTIPAAAVYGGAVVVFPTPLRQPTTATAIYCANVTTGASTKVSASGYKGI